MYIKNKLHRGLTLLEIIIVVAIIAMIAAATINIFGGGQQRRMAIKTAGTALVSAIDFTAKQAKSLSYPPILNGPAGGPAVAPAANTELLFKVYKKRPTGVAELINTTEIGNNTRINLLAPTNLSVIPTANIASGVFGQLEQQNGNVLATFLFTPSGKLTFSDTTIPNAGTVDLNDKFAVMNTTVTYNVMQEGYLNFGGTDKPTSLGYNMQGQAKISDGHATE